jgi:GPR180/TMEM145, transmembrane domain
MLSNKTLLTIGIAMMMCGIAIGMRTSGKIHETGKGTSNKFQYVSKFCFTNQKAPKAGLIKYKTWSKYATEEGGKTELLLYDDEKDKPYYWNDNYFTSKKTCFEKSQDSYTRLDPAREEKSIVKDTKEPSGWTNQDIENYKRPHYWYVAVSRCSNATLELNYEMHFENPGMGWDTEFSCEEQGLLTMYIVFFVVWLLIAGAQAYATYALHRRRALHLLVRLLSAAVFMELFSLFFTMIHYAVYSSDGKGVPALDAIGDVFDFLSTMTFMLLLIFLSKGWAITRYQFIELEGKRILIGILITLFLGYLAMFIWQELGLDPEKNLWIYETIPGIILLVLRVLTMFYFLANIFFTLRGEDRHDKRRFYFFIALVYGIWFALLPIFAGIAAAVDDWVRTKVVMAASLSSTTIFYTVLCVLMWPSLSDKYFEFTPPGAFDAQGGFYDTL